MPPLPGLNGDLPNNTIDFRVLVGLQGKSSEGNLREKENKTKFKKLDDSEMCTIYNYNLSYNYIKLHKTCLSVMYTHRNTQRLN